MTPVSASLEPANDRQRDSGVDRLALHEVDEVSFQPKTVGDLINYEYAKLIAIAIHGSYPGAGTSPRLRALFWGTHRSVHAKLNRERINPSSLLRENKLLIEESGKCAYCGAEEGLQWEHIVPRARGGPDSIDNLVQACRACNLSKATKDVYELYRGRTHEAPRLVWGKYLKLLRHAHREAGSWDSSEYPSGQPLSRGTLALVFGGPA